MLSVDQARERILAATATIGSESVPLAEAGGRILGCAIAATRALPPFDNSAMDGFAVRSVDLPGTLDITATIAAGDDGQATLGPGSAARIMTGAPLPSGADAVVMREEVDDRVHQAHFERPARAGQHIRRRGEDIDIGERAVAAGVELGAGEIALLAALGCAQVEVARRPTVAILSTGSELVEVEGELGPGQIVNSNGIMLAAQVREAGAAPDLLASATDDRSALEESLAHGLTRDVLLTTGGVSVGDFDFVKDVLPAVGVEIEFWKVAMKPGKPVVFGRGPGGTLVFGLPGNPVSAMTTFEIFVRPVLRKLMGAADLHRPRVPVSLARAYAKRPGRTHFVRAGLERRGAELWATPHDKQSSGMLSSLVGVDCLAEIDAEAGDLPQGSQVPALLLHPR